LLSQRDSWDTRACGRSSSTIIRNLEVAETSTRVANLGRRSICVRWANIAMATANFCYITISSRDSADMSRGLELASSGTARRSMRSIITLFRSSDNTITTNRSWGIGTFHWAFNVDIDISIVGGIGSIVEVELG
jgi:hypothetical protein